MNAIEELEDYVENAGGPAAMAAVSERARWTELVFAVLDRANGGSDPIAARRATILLDELGLLDLRRLASLAGDEATTDGAVYAAVLGACGYADSDTSRAALTLADVSSFLEKEQGGRIQRYLAVWAKELIADFGRCLSEGALAPSDFEYAATLWLQNTANMPLPLPHPAVEAFRARHGLTDDDLIDIATDLGVSAASVDDLVLAAGGSTDQT